MLTSKLSLFFFVFNFLCIISISQSFGQSTNCTTECHIDLQAETHINSAVTKCQECHKEILVPHPQKEKKTFSTLNDKCLNCHEQVLNYEILHPPVAAGECSACHNPHRNKKNSYIKDNGRLICSSCHAPVFSQNDTYLHGDLNHGKCQACHAQHGSQFPKLLKGGYSPAYFNDYKKEHYDFCFRCHKIDLLLHPKTSYNTNFRDGKNNLHYTHVNRQLKGRACKNCHEIHAGSNEKLMKTSVQFGTWLMPINFKKTDNGGKCAPGCHAPKSYDRALVGRKSR